MGERDDDLGLSLSLGGALNESSLKLNLMTPLASNQQKTIWNELFHSSGMFSSPYSGNGFNLIL